MVDVEQRALRALEQDAFAFAPLGVEQAPDRLGIRQHARRQLLEFPEQRVAVDLLKPHAAAERVVVGQQPVDLARQRIEVGKVHQPDRAAADLVLIGRTDAAPGGADRRPAFDDFAQRIELAVQAENQRDVFGDPQIVRTDGDLLRAQTIDLVEKRLGIEHDTVADHRQL